MNPWSSLWWNIGWVSNVHFLIDSWLEHLFDLVLSLNLRLLHQIYQILVLIQINWAIDLIIVGIGRSLDLLIPCLSIWRYTAHLIWNGCPSILWSSLLYRGRSLTFWCGHCLSCLLLGWRMWSFYYFWVDLIVLSIDGSFHFIWRIWWRPIILVVPVNVAITMSLFTLELGINVRVWSVELTHSLILVSQILLFFRSWLAKVTFYNWVSWRHGSWR